MDTNGAGSPSYKYYICEFTDCVNADGVTEKDIVPSSWIEYNNQRNVLLVPYPDPPYTKAKCIKLQKAVKLNTKPDEACKWKVQIKGGANSYETAEYRLAKMKADNYAFTTDQENESKAEDETNLFRHENLKSILTVSSEEDENNSFFEEEMSDNSSSTSDSRVKTNKQKIVKRTQVKKKIQNKKKNKKSSAPVQPQISSKLIQKKTSSATPRVSSQQRAASQKKKIASSNNIF